MVLADARGRIGVVHGEVVRSVPVALHRHVRVVVKRMPTFLTQNPSSVCSV